MFTVDSHILRLVEASIEPAWRQQRQLDVVLDPVAADEFFAGYLDELADDEHTKIIRLDVIRSERKDRETQSSVRYLFDDVLRLAIPASQYAPLG